MTNASTPSVVNFPARFAIWSPPLLFSYFFKSFSCRPSSSYSIFPFSSYFSFSSDYSSFPFFRRSISLPPPSSPLSPSLLNVYQYRLPISGQQRANEEYSSAADTKPIKFEVAKGDIRIRYQADEDADIGPTKDQHLCWSMMCTEHLRFCYYLGRVGLVGKGERVRDCLANNISCNFRKSCKWQMISSYMSDLLSKRFYAVIYKKQYPCLLNLYLNYYFDYLSDCYCDF